MPTRTPLDPSRVQSVLLIRLRSIGDAVLMTPCLQALHDWQPAVEIGVVIEPLAAPVVEGHPLIDHLFIAGRSLASKFGLLTEIRRKQFDVAFNLHGGTTGMLLAAMSGAKRTVGYRDQRGSWLLSERAPAPNIILARDRIHSVEQQLALLRWAGVPMPAQPRLTVEIASDAAASARRKLLEAGLTAASLTSGRFAVVAPGAAFESKRWTSRGFASVIDHLSSRWQLESVVIAGPGQERLASDVAAASESSPRILSGLSLPELKAVIEVGRLFVGNDSGPMHIAAALNCPVVAMFGSSNPDVWRPWTRADYRTLGGERGSVDSDLRGRIDTVEVDEVIAAVDEVLQSAASQTAS